MYGGHSVIELYDPIDPPKYIQLYVHRSGRTARAQREGLSVMLVGPEDVKAYRNICKSLNKGSTQSLLVMSVFPLKT